MPDSHKPEGWPTVVPRTFADDAAGLVAFMRDVFGATGDYDGARPAEMWIGESVIMVSGTEARAAAAAFLYVYVPDVDDAYRRAMHAGCRSHEAPLDTPYGDRRCMVEDGWGNTWQIATRMR